MYYFAKYAILQQQNLHCVSKHAIFILIFSNFLSTKISKYVHLQVAAFSDSVSPWGIQPFLSLSLLDQK